MTKDWLRVNSKRINAWIIGLGFILFIIHNPDQPLLEYAFLPVIGLLISLFGCLTVLMPKWSEEKKQIIKGFYWQKPIWDFDLGNKYIYIPLLIIAVSIAISGFINGADMGEKIAPMFFGSFLFAVYLASRKLGKEIFLPFAVFVVIEAISCLVYGIMYSGARAGGIIGWTSSNTTGGLYAIAVRFLVFGSLVSIFKKQWLIISIALLGLCFTGSEEALLAVAVLGVALLIRKDWSKKLIVPIAVIVIFVSIAVPVGIAKDLIRPWGWYAESVAQIPSAETSEETSTLLDKATNNRWTNYVNVFKNLKPFGNGYNITNFYVGIPHNVPLIIIDQVGILASLAWLFVMFYCLVKTKWKYAFIGVLALSILDHAIWTQAAPWVWCLIGVASSSEIQNDYIFKKDLT